MTSFISMSVSALLDPYKKLVEDALTKNLPYLGPQTKLKEACSYALMSGGKRFRPALVFIIAQALKRKIDVSLAAIAVEYFHTASLIADDLPCMDNDEERRNQQSVHKKYGQSIALLATYALIAAGYRCLVENARRIATSSHPLASQSDLICTLAVENATYNTGLMGATGGQFLDLYPPDQSLNTLLEVIDKKTVSLFEISFVLGWLFGGGAIGQLELVKKSAAHFGRAFQIVDDLEDQQQDKINLSSVNLVNKMGKNRAIELFTQEVEQFDHTLENLALCSEELKALKACMVNQVKKFC